MCLSTASLRKNGGRGCRHTAQRILEPPAWSRVPPVTSLIQPFNTFPLFYGTTKVNPLQPNDTHGSHRALCAHSRTPPQLLLIPFCPNHHRDHTPSKASVFQGCPSWRFPHFRLKQHWSVSRHHCRYRGSKVVCTFQSHSLHWSSRNIAAPSQAKGLSRASLF
jgi:hypothetical protein